MSRKCMLTTIDNPFNPFENYSSWNRYDKECEYDSSELLARFAHVSEQLTDEENDEEIERAIDEIVKFDLTGMRIKAVSKDKSKALA